MTIDIEINRQDYSDFNTHHFLKTRLRRTALTGVLTIVILQYILNRDGFDLTATIISSTVCVLLYVFLINRNLQKTKNIPDENGTILGKKTIIFDDDEIICKDSNSKTDLKWTSIKRIDVGKSAIYLYIDTNMAILVPKRHFVDKDSQDKFVAMVEGKINAA